MSMSPDDQRRAPALRVIVTGPLGRPQRDPGIGRWLQRVAPATARGWMGVALVSDARIRALNRAFARNDRATDVLSFPACGNSTVFRQPVRAARGAAGEAWLGDIAIATGFARRQAAAARHSLRTELRILALHGLLHLLGYDHTGGEGTMARVERRLRDRGGLREGLIERARRRAPRRAGR
jgi:probable rRNA maturation factor